MRFIGDVPISSSAVSLGYLDNFGVIGGIGSSVGVVHAVVGGTLYNTAGLAGVGLASTGTIGSVTIIG